MKYILIVYYNFEGKKLFYSFNDYIEACEYLKEMWQYCYNIQINCVNGDEVDKEDSYCKEGYAQLKWKDGDGRFWRIEEVKEPSFDNKIEWIN